MINRFLHIGGLFCLRPVFFPDPFLSYSILSFLAILLAILELEESWSSLFPVGNWLNNVEAREGED